MYTEYLFEFPCRDRKIAESFIDDVNKKFTAEQLTNFIVFVNNLPPNPHIRVGLEFKNEPPAVREWLSSLKGMTPVFNMSIANHHMRKDQEKWEACSISPFFKPSFLDPFFIL